MTNEDIQNHIETNCRNIHGRPMMNEQEFYEGAKWARDQMTQGQSNVSKSFTKEQLIDMHDDAYSEQFEDWREKWF